MTENTEVVFVNALLLKVTIQLTHFHLHICLFFNLLKYIDEKLKNNDYTVYIHTIKNIYGIV